MNQNLLNMKAVFMGLGYVGLCTAALAASNGVDVLGVDINQSVVDIINAGKIHISEPGLSRLVSEVVAAGKLNAAVRAEEADCFFISVTTPLKQNHRADLSFVEAATKTVIPYLKAGALLAIESTCPVGTTDKMADLVYKARPELKDKIHIAYCPHRVLPGNVLYELVHNDRVIGGINRKSALKAMECYRIFTKGALEMTSARTAELCKLTENCATDAQMAFANELSILCDNMNVNVWELIKLANKHPHINILNPSCGVGGPEMEVDPWLMVSAYPEQTNLIKRIREANEYKPDWCANKILDTCAQFEKFHQRSPVIACMGLSYKPDIDNCQQSPAHYIVGRIITESGAEVLVAEPHLLTHADYQLSHWKTAYEKADIIVWLVKHEAFAGAKVDLSKLELDFCGIRN